MQSSGDTLTKCASATIQIDSVRYSTAWSSRFVNITIETTGTQVLKNLTFTVAGGGGSVTSMKFFNVSGDDLIPGTAFSASVNAANISVPPEQVAASAFCLGGPKTFSCYTGQPCMAPTT